MGTVSDWLDDITPATEQVGVCFNQRLYRDYQEAVVRLQSSREDGLIEQPDEVVKLAEQAQALLTRIEQDQERHTFRFETVAYDRWAKARDEHPASDGQRERNPWVRWDEDAFPPVAVALACVEPEMSVDEANELRQRLPRAEFDRLFQAALKVNDEGTALSGKESRIVGRLVRELKSTSPAEPDGPSPSSEDG